MAKKKSEEKDASFVGDGPSRVTSSDSNINEETLIIAPSIPRVGSGNKKLQVDVEDSDSENEQDAKTNTKNIVRKSVFVPSSLIDNTPLLDKFLKKLATFKRIFAGVLITFFILVLVIGALLYIYTPTFLSGIMPKKGSSDPSIARYSAMISEPIKNNILIKSSNGSPFINVQISNHVSVDYSRIPTALIYALGTVKVAGGLPSGVDYNNYVLSLIAGELARGFIVNNFGNSDVNDVINQILVDNSPDKILSYYLSSAYFGSGIIGIENASVAYFSKPFWSLDVAESVSLIAIMQFPLRGPFLFPNSTKNNASALLQAMLNARLISQQDFLTANARLPSVFSNANPNSISSLTAIVIDDIFEKMPSKILPDSMIFSTTINQELQNSLERNVEQTVKSGFSARIDSASGIIVAKDGSIRAISSFSLPDNKFPNVVYMPRQGGKVYDVFMYLAGAMQGLTSDSIISIAKPVVRAKNQRNDAALLRNSYKNQVSGISNSSINNIASALGVFNIQSSDYLISGTKLTTLRDIIAPYTILINQGVLRSPFLVLSVTNKDNKVFFSRVNDSQPQSLSYNAISTVLSVIRSNQVMNTNKNLSKIRGGIGGVSPDGNTSWFIGVGSELVLGGWVGSDKSLPLRYIDNSDITATMLDDSLN